MEKKNDYLSLMYELISLYLLFVSLLWLGWIGKKIRIFISIYSHLIRHWHNNPFWKKYLRCRKKTGMPDNSSKVQHKVFFSFFHFSLIHLFLFCARLILQNMPTILPVALVCPTCFLSQEAATESIHASHYIMRVQALHSTDI